MKKTLFFVVPLLLFANQEIKNVKFIGLKHMSVVSANEISLLHKGDEFNLDDVNEAIKKFYSYGYFENIIANYNNGILTYKFIEKPSIYQIKYKNISNDLKEELKDKIKRGMIFSEEKLNDIKKFIVTYYDAKGNFNTVVIFDKKFTKDGVILTINVNKGPEIIINNLKFYGIKKESISDIKSNLINKDEDLLGWLPFRNNGKFRIQGLLKDQKNIKEFYLSKGYLDSEISNPFFVANFDNNKALLSYKIHEGIRYKVSNIKISINSKKNIIDLKKYKENLYLRKGLYFSIKRVKKDIKMLKTAIADKGYAYVMVYPDISKKHNGKVDVIYKIITGNKVYISDVIIEGNYKTLDRVIRRNIYLTPGSLYSLTDKEDTIKALKRTGYFDDIKLKEIKVDDSHIKILVKLKEGLTGSLKAGISYNSYSQLGFNFNISERNIFGSGQSIGANFENTRKSLRYSFNLRNPRVLDSEYSLGTSIYKNSFEGLSYTSDKKGISFTVGKQLTRNINSSITYGYEKVHLTDVQNEIYYKQNSIKSYLLPAIHFNNTDDYWFPQHGINAALSMQYAGIGGDQRFIKNKIYAKYFYSLEDKFDILTILKYKFTLANAIDTGYLPLNEKYYIGGSGTVRGYGYSSISPKDSNDNEIGGKIMMINSAEISIPISIKRKMWLSGFIDNGKIGDNNLNISRSSYGVSIDWITPIGPLDFTWAFPINNHEGDDLRKFEFSIGSGF